MSIEDFYDQTCDVVVQTRQQDRSGAPSREPYTVVAAALPCLFDSKGSTVEDRNGRRIQVERGTVYLAPPSGFTLSAKHQLRIPDTTGRAYVILGISDPNSLGHHLEVAVEAQV